MTSPITLAPYDPTWPAQFHELAAAIRSACHPYVTHVHHIGSTSVPGLPAKPIIDLMPQLASFEAGEAIVEPMRQLGFEAFGEYGIPRRHYFHRRGATQPDANVHCFAHGEGQWHWHLAFRDHLRTHAADRDRYFQLKTELAARHPHDVEAYADAKSEFIRAILSRYLHVDESLAAR